MYFFLNTELLCSINQFITRVARNQKNAATVKRLQHFDLDIWEEVTPSRALLPLRYLR